MLDPALQSNTITRRRALQWGAAGAALAPLSMRQITVQGADPSRARRRVLRFAHLTDMHVQPELNAAQGLTTCLRHVQSHDDRVELIITGGDSVMDAFEVDSARSQMLVDLWRGIFKQECSLPVRHCIGNHDSRPWAPTAAGELAGKQWAMDMFGLKTPYYAFDQAGWRFLVLDSVLPAGTGYTSGLDPAQRRWLEAQLKQKPPHQPVAIISHIPVLSVTPLTFDDEHTSGGMHQISGPFMHLDGTSLHYLFRDHNVKLCLSGHMHLVDRCEIDGVAYICSGAVCANWWKGNLQRVDEGYGVVDLYDDGSFDFVYTPYGWEAEPA